MRHIIKFLLEVIGFTFLLFLVTAGLIALLIMVDPKRAIDILSVGFDLSAGETFTSAITRHATALQSMIADYGLQVLFGLWIAVFAFVGTLILLSKNHPGE